MNPILTKAEPLVTQHIPLSQGQFAVVDDVDYAQVSQYKWYAQRHRRTFYARRNVGLGKQRTTIRMHRFILGLGPGDPREVDHKDGNGLNNTRANLRITNDLGNALNAVNRPPGPSGYRGVYWHQCRGRRGRWLANITANGRRLSLGRYDTPEEAARVYNAAALKYHGEFARPNEVEEAQP